MSILKTIDRAARMAAVAALLVAFNPGAVVRAQQPSSASMALAKQLIAINGGINIYSPLVPGVIEQAKLLFLQQDPGLQKDLNEVAANLRTEYAPRISEVTDQLAKLYATTFTEQELKEVVAFYQTPAGKKLLVAQPQVAEQSMRFAQDWAKKLSDEIVAKMREQMKKKGHVL